MSAKQKSLDNILADEVKQEIAGRYFGFRKLIEEDTQDYTQKIRRHSVILEKRISFDLIRLYLLLGREELIQQFLQLAGLKERLFFDPYLLESPTIQQRVFECQRFKGWTRKGRFVRYSLTCYDNLAFHVKLYHQKLQELANDRYNIMATIEAFYEQNNISAILAFLRSLGDDHSTGAMQGDKEIGLAEGLDEKLKINPPAPLEQMLPLIKPLPPMVDLKRPLRRLFKQAYLLQKPEIISLFDAHSTPCPERDYALKTDR
ncbi:hypothetical protein [Desulfurivibrio alkaliphilus]|uniref:Uncharacterized protein n=1 Tax=Desulfurivibrio alkaliphilus (strain DSM 19089 / UNIQEM U267 / AHT2) TaxID=589865 RepID=D6Z642_DESAT|nr:hypothetical protein [Desulfurivibrio alkaliphilus]ADH84924.1 hypothetical protein DaAHT2_0213 [Desulfurivibrio alkaliphilus AHT 2]